MLESSEYDAIIIGTGLAESIVACKLTKASKRVLQIDTNGHYGGGFSAFTLSGFISWAVSHGASGPAQEFSNIELGFGPGFAIPIGPRAHAKERVGSALPRPEPSEKTRELLEQISAHVPEDKRTSSHLKELGARLAGLLEHDRKYSIELSPKLTRCRGSLIDLLVEAGVAEYLEFKGVQGNYLVERGAMERVPESKEDVFASKALKLVEKRKLMKLLESIGSSRAAPAAPLDDGGRGSFARALKSQFRIDGWLLDAVLYCVARARDEGELAAGEGYERVRRYVSSIGRFGRMAFLSSMHGGGSELVQAFCRSCAVGGGTYILGERVARINADPSGGVVAELGHGTARAKRAVVGPGFVLASWAGAAEHRPVSRGVWVFPETVVAGARQGGDDGEPADSCGADEVSALMSYVRRGGAPAEGAAVVSLVYFTHSTMVVPKGHSVLYAWAAGDLASTRALLNEAVESTVRAAGSSAEPVFSALFECKELDVSSSRCSIPGVVFAPGPDTAVDFDSAADEAQRIVDEILALDEGAMEEP